MTRLSRIPLTLCLVAFAAMAQAATYTVTSSANNGVGTLRQAMLDANASGQPSDIIFDIPGASGTVHTINVSVDRLPPLTVPTHIDGSSQDGYSTTPLVILDGASLVYQVGHSGLILEGTGSTVTGIGVSNFQANAIILRGGGGHTVRGCVLSGSSVDLGSYSGCGVLIHEATAPCTVGGTAPGDGNVIKSNRFGIEIDSTDGHQVLGNIIGLEADGTTLAGNAVYGIWVKSGGNQIGDGTAAGRNIISGNGNSGLEVVGYYESGSGADNTISGNYIGLDITGTLKRANVSHGMYLASAPDTVITNNVISGNGYMGMLMVSSAGVRIQGNIFGLDPTGTVSLPNFSSNIYLQSVTDGLIGGTGPGEGNTTSQGTYGILCFTASGFVIKGNNIGTDITGTVKLANTVAGIGMFDGCYANQIGGPEAGAGNVFAGATNGIYLYGVGSSNNVIQGNFVGTDRTGTIPMGTATRGIAVRGGADDNLIGGTVAGAGNVVAHNLGDGVIVDITTVRTRILGNSIHSNSGLGIDLSSNGVSANDPQDSDTGNNNLQNFPDVQRAYTGAEGGGTSISGVLRSGLSGTYRVEVFANDSCDSSGFGEGRTFLGGVDVTTDASGNAPFSLDLAYDLAAGQSVTATATDAVGNTSEFSACRSVRLPEPLIEVSSAAVNFGPVLVSGGPSTSLPVTVTNIGILDLSFTGAGFEIIGADAGEFSLTNSPSTADLVPDASRMVAVAFDPSSTGTKAAILRITSNSAQTPTVDVQLAGNGVDDPNMVSRLYNGAGPGTSTIGPGGNYTTLKAACDAINGTPLTGGDWTFEILANLTETQNCAIGQATNGHSIFFRPSDGASPKVTFSVSTNPSSTTFGGHFHIGSRLQNDGGGRPVLHPTANVVIDGSPVPGGTVRNLTFEASQGTTGRTNVFQIVGNSDGIQLRNLNIVGGLTTASPSTYGVLFTQIYDPANGVTTAIPDNGVVENCAITNNLNNVAQGIANLITALSASPAASNGSTGMVFKDNVITVRARGFFLGNTMSADITDNTINVAQPSPATNGFGVLQIDAGHVLNGVSINFSGNTFAQLNSTTNTAGYGIVGLSFEGAGAGTELIIRNNSIGGLRWTAPGVFSAGLLNGIRYLGGGNATIIVENNSINALTPVGTLVSGFSPDGVAGISIGSGSIGFSGSAVIRNNIIRWPITNGAAVYRTPVGTPASWIADGNDLFVTNGAVTGSTGVQAYATLADWQGATGADANSVALDPMVANAPGTGFWPLEGAGAVNSTLHFQGEPGVALRSFPISGVNRDVEGELRSLSAPVIGCDEVARDLDSDGVAEGVEDHAANGGDGNDDGTSDSVQGNVASFSNLVDAQYVTIATPTGTALEGVTALLKPAGVGDNPTTFPLGLFSFKITGLEAGASTEATVYLPAGTNAGSYGKYGRTPDNQVPHWYDFGWNGFTGVTTAGGGDVLTLHYIDGLRGDDDLSANGQVSDPGGPLPGELQSRVEEWSVYD